jgi:CDP-diacylglycerol--glycerol-3-phosphate 3-phosphatidyltransferase
VTILPLFLTALRAALAPVVVLLAFRFHSRPAFALCLIVAFLSDIFDGVLARRLGVAGPGLRRLDSIADSFFYVGAAIAVWHLYPAAITDRWMPLAALVVIELGRYTFDFFKFRRETAYHMWSSKLWGITLFAGFSSLLVFGQDGYLVAAAIYVGLVADLEGLAISFTLQRWHSDVPSLYHAMRLQTLAEPTEPLERP